MHFAEAARQFNITKRRGSDEYQHNRSWRSPAPRQPIVPKLRLCSGGGPLVIARRCCGVTVTDKDRGSLATQTRHDNLKPPTFLRRCFDIAEWIIPGAILALLPKCPLCLAAYLALITGVGFSMSTLMYLRMTLLTLCTASLLYLAVRSIRRARQSKLCD
jgi:hypothetical protein